MAENEYSWYPDALVLGPGGMKGFLELGALIKLYNSKFLENIKIYVGCSVGSIIALLLVSGYTPNQIVKEAAKASIFEDITSLCLSDIKNNTGLISNKQIKEKLESKVRKKFGFIPTLQQLYLSTGFEYISVTLNLDKDQTEFLSFKTEPNLSCVEAALLSMNIPFLFYKIQYRGCVYIDGAFGNPYPIDIVDDGKTNILGISILSGNTLEISNSNVLCYIYKVIQSSMTQIRLRIEKSCSEKCKHLILQSPTIDTTGLTIDEETKVKMLISGYRIAETFLNSLQKKIP